MRTRERASGSRYGIWLTAPRRFFFITLNTPYDGWLWLVFLKKGRKKGLTACVSLGRFRFKFAGVVLAEGF